MLQQLQFHFICFSFEFNWYTLVIATVQHIHSFSKWTTWNNKRSIQKLFTNNYNLMRLSYCFLFSRIYFCFIHIAISAYIGQITYVWVSFNRIALYCTTTCPLWSTNEDFFMYIQRYCLASFNFRECKQKHLHLINNNNKKLESATETCLQTRLYKHKWLPNCTYRDSPTSMSIRDHRDNIYLLLTKRCTPHICMRALSFRFLCHIFEIKC